MMTKEFRILAAAILATLLFPHGPPGPEGPGSWSVGGAPAFADDDDDDDDDADGGGASSGGGGGAGGSVVPLENTPRQTIPGAPQVPAPAALAQQAPTEILVLDLDPEDLGILLTEGYVVVSENTLPALLRDLTRLAIPGDVTLEAARDRVRALATGSDADFNHYYRTEQGAEPVSGAAPLCAHENCRAWEMIDWPLMPSGPALCPVDLPIGMIDTGINAAHEIVAGASLEILSLADAQATPSQAVHGTAVASLLIGRPDARVPGFVPAARVVAVDAFTRDGGDERADLASILRGLDALAAEGVRVINLSLAGPGNRLLEDTVGQLVNEAGIVIVAAAGNAGPRAEAAYPAGYETTIAVTAVDVTARIYRQAQRGAHIDLAAPGVNVLAATSISGARLQSGTSFATPVVTAAAALVLSRNPELTPAEVAAILIENARDLGAPGMDEIFGHGLIQTAGLCAAQGVQP